MREKFANAYDTLTNHMCAPLAVVCIVLLFTFGFALGFGLALLFAWVMMMIYNAIAGYFAWPTFSIWFWLGVEFVVQWLRTGKLPITVGGDKTKEE